MSAMPEPIKDAAYWTESALLTWARFMRGSDLPDGLPSEVGILENFSGYDANSEHAYDKLDGWIADTTHAAICELIPIENAAIYNVYLQAIYRFPRGNYSEVLDRARANVQAGLRRRGVWLGDDA